MVKNLRQNLPWRLLITVLLFLAFPAKESLSQSGIPIRLVIAKCWQQGAINEFMMLQCSGAHVPTQVFIACMNGGPCLGEPPIGQGSQNKGSPTCGALGLPYCPQPSPCGYPDTITCPPPPGYPFPPFPVARGCGKAPFPPCHMPQLCGLPTTFPCTAIGNVFIPAHRVSSVFNSWHPTLQVALPRSNYGQLGQHTAQIKFATPVVPDLNRLKNCRNGSADENEFMECLVDRAMPSSYKLTKACVSSNSDDLGAAFVCSTGNSALQDKYERVKQVQECASSASDKVDLANCVGQQVLGSNERYYANCVAHNRDASGAMVCALAKDLTPEQQIALNCAVTTGGEPHAYAACVGGQLTQREISKCWDYGIATDSGCFGPNNEIRKYWNTVDGSLRTALGENSVVYEAFVFYKDNVAMPGPGHEFVRAANTVIGDLKNGPGPGNDGLKAIQAVSGGIQSIATSVGNALGLRF